MPFVTFTFIPEFPADNEKKVWAMAPVDRIAVIAAMVIIRFIALCVL